jgi:Transcription activator MBF2
VLDQLKPGTGAVPTYNSGGVGENYVKINVAGKYGHGIHFKVIIWGKLPASENESNEI